MTLARVTEIIASPKKSFEDATAVVIARAVKTLNDVKGAWVESQKIVVEKNKITEYRVSLRVKFVLAD